MFSSPIGVLETREVQATAAGCFLETSRVSIPARQWDCRHWPRSPTGGEFEPLANQVGRLERQAGDVATGRARVAARPRLTTTSQLSRAAVFIDRDQQPMV